MALIIHGSTSAAAMAVAVAVLGLVLCGLGASLLDMKEISRGSLWTRMVLT